MVYWIENGKMKKTETKDVMLDGKNRYWGVFSFEETDEICDLLRVDRVFLNQFLKNTATRFESHDGFDAISYNVTQYSEDAVQVKRACMIVRKDLFLIVADNPDAVLAIVGEIGEDVEKQTGFDRLYYTFFERATQDDAALLDGIEQEIAALEDQLIVSGRKNCVVEIITLRKKLMYFKRNYEQTLNVLDDIQENENELIDQKSMRYFKIYANRVDRLYHIVLNLRDYVTQVREAYQAEVDISLNGVMKLFTVITAIFLPLTLIVGWYGMNLKMPEYEWQYGYHLVIIICTAVVVFGLFYFKRHNWFR